MIQTRGGSLALGRTHSPSCYFHAEILHIPDVLAAFQEPLKKYNDITTYIQYILILYSLLL